jgi:hypothetical protein
MPVYPGALRIARDAIMIAELLAVGALVVQWRHGVRRDILGYLMNEFAWETEHSVSTEASPEFVWAYMSDVANWDAPPCAVSAGGSVCDRWAWHDGNARAAAPTLATTGRAADRVLHN